MIFSKFLTTLHLFHHIHAHLLPVTVHSLVTSRHPRESMELTCAKITQPKYFCFVPDKIKVIKESQEKWKMLQKLDLFDQVCCFHWRESCQSVANKETIIWGTTGEQLCALLQVFDSHFCALDTHVYPSYSHQRCWVLDCLNMHLVVSGCVFAWVNLFLPAVLCKHPDVSS